MNANRGFSAVLHARATRGILLSLRTAWHVHPPSNGYILLGGEKGREGENTLCSRFFLVSIRTGPSLLFKSNFPFSRRYDIGEYQVM